MVTGLPGTPLLLVSEDNLPSAKFVTYSERVVPPPPPPFELELELPENSPCPHAPVVTAKASSIASRGQRCWVMLGKALGVNRLQNLMNAPCLLALPRSFDER
jgi:hypothetical protein